MMLKPIDCTLNRRQFLHAAGGTLALGTLLRGSNADAAPLPGVTPIYPKGKARVPLIFCRPDGAAREERVRLLTTILTLTCPRLDFSIRTARNADEAAAIAREFEDADGLLAVVMQAGTGAPAVLARTGRPTVLVDDGRAGVREAKSLEQAASLDRLPVVAASTSAMSDALNAVWMFRVLRAMKESTLLAATDDDVTAQAGQIQALFGTNVVRIGSEELATGYEKVRADEAEAWADRWAKQARKVSASREALVREARMYLALSRAAADCHADAVTLDCKGLCGTGRVPAYPCMSHFQMNDDGGCAMCRGDLNAACMQLLLRYITWRPGYMVAPQADGSKDTVVYTQTACASRVFGPREKGCAYVLRPREPGSEVLVPQAMLPLHEPVTTAALDVAGRRMGLHTARLSANGAPVAGCGTALEAKGDAESIRAHADAAAARVSVLGDWRKRAVALARLYGMSLAEEDRPT